MKLLLAVVIVAALAWLVFQVTGPDAPEEGEPFLTAGGGEEPRADRVPAPPTGEAGRAQPPPSAVEGGSAHPLPAGSAPPVVSRAEVGEPLGIEGRLELREGDRTVVVYRDDRRLAEFGARGEPRPPVVGARLVSERQALRIWEMPASVGAWEGLAAAAAAQPQRRLSPLYYRSASRLGNPILLPGGVTVQFPADWNAERIADFAAREGLVGGVPLSLGPTWYRFPSAAGEAALRLAMRIQATGEVLLAKADWAERHALK